MKKELVKLAKEIMETPVNSTLAQMFEDLALYEYSIGRGFPASAFRKTAKAIINAKDIFCFEDINEIPNIGNSSKEVIKQFLDTGISSRHQKALNQLLLH